MHRLEFIVWDPKKFYSAIFIVFFALPVALVMAMGGNTNAANNNYPPAYTGGAPVSKVFHLTDGSTRTITCTGAVIKQGQNGNPYREGWIDPDNINNIKVASDVRGQIQPGASNPYGSDHNCPTQTTSKPADTGDYNSDKDKNRNKTSTRTNTSTTYVTTANTPTTKAPVADQTPVTYQQPTVVTTAGSTAPTNLPKTGPGDVAAIGGLTTIFSSIAHYLYTRRRLA